MSARISIPDCVADALDAAARKAGLTGQQALIRAIGLLQKSEAVGFFDIEPRKSAGDAE